MLNKINNKKTTQEKVNFKFQFFLCTELIFFVNNSKQKQLLKNSFSYNNRDNSPVDIHNLYNLYNSNLNAIEIEANNTYNTKSLIDSSMDKIV